MLAKKKKYCKLDIASMFQKYLNIHEKFQIALKIPK